MSHRFFETIHDVYFDDLDAFHILHNARYIILFERSIGAFWRHLGWKTGIESADHPDQWHLVRTNQIEYLRPVRGVDQVRVRAWVRKLGTTSITFALTCLPTDSDNPYATGSRVLVRVDRETREKTAWTDEFREMVAPYCEKA